MWCKYFMKHIFTQGDSGLESPRHAFLSDAIVHSRICFSKICTSTSSGRSSCKFGFKEQFATMVFIPLAARRIVQRIRSRVPSWCKGYTSDPWLPFGAKGINEIRASGALWIPPETWSDPDMHGSDGLSAFRPPEVPGRLGLSER